MESHRFRAMGTHIELLVRGAVTPERAAAVEDEFERLEQSMSRFRADSELSCLNREGRIVASRPLLEVVTAAVEARERTGGLFDPTVHDALVAAGYDRSFEDLDGRVAAYGERRACGGEIRLDGRRITLARGVRLDLGGIAKGYAADRACDVLSEDGPCVVNAGGDVVARGGAWPVGVETATGSITLLLDDGAVATSGSDRRRWAVAGRPAHHLIDPRTGRPAESDLLRVSVVARSAIDAEVLAKAAFLGGEVDAPRVLVTVDGRTVLAGGLE
jgi:FAD:protein FMN transferase